VQGVEKGHIKQIFYMYLILLLGRKLVV